MNRGRFFVGRGYYRGYYGRYFLPRAWGFGYPYYFYHWPLWMQYYWLYNNDMMYQTSAASEYLQSLQVSQEEVAMLQEQVQALQAQGATPQAAIDEQTVMEYVQMLQNEGTPDSEIEQFFQQKGLTDDQILILQQQAVKQMEGINAGQTAPIPPAAPAGAPGMEVKYCSTCGKELPAGANFCDACGARQ